MGGYGWVYNIIFNDYVFIGDGLVMVAIVGIFLEDMEFVQFYFMGLYLVGVLIFEVVWGEGVYLINSEGCRFMEDYVFSCMELVFRDIIFWVIILEIWVGWGVNVDGSVGGFYVYLDLCYMGWEKIMSCIFFCWEEVYCLVGIDVVE